jgi:hypothetical protein
MNINADYNSDQFRSKISFFTPIRQLAESKLILTSSSSSAPRRRFFALRQLAEPG